MNRPIHLGHCWLLSCAIALFYVGGISGQDLHYTNYDFAPHYLNPAKAGDFYGTFRIGGIYRQQFSSFIEEPFQSPMAYVDMPIRAGFSPNHWIGASIAFYTDKSGDLDLKNTGILGGLSYHIGFDDDLSNVFTIGAQYGMIQRSTDGSKALFADQLLGQVAQSQDRTLIDDYSGSFSDINVGVQFTHRRPDGQRLEIGAAMYHLSKPSLRFSGGSVENPIERRLNAYASYRIIAGDRLHLIPRLFYSRMASATNASIQLMGRTPITKTTGRGRNKTVDVLGVLSFGVGYRLDDAVQILVGGEFKDWHVGASYDLTVSGASAYNDSFGGFEVGLYKIIKIYRKPKAKRHLFCPRF